MTSSERAIDWVVFDLGGVVLARTSRLPDLASLLNVEVDTLITGYQRHRLAYDQDSDAAAFWAGATAAAGIAAPSQALLEQLVELDEDGWSGTIPETLSLIEDLRSAGYGLAVCSNAPSSMGARIRRQPWAQPFQHLVFSGDLGVVKPDPTIFDSVVAATGSSPDRMVFLDDLAVNVDGALAAGWHAYQFTDAEHARADLEALGIHLNQSNACQEDIPNGGI